VRRPAKALVAIFASLLSILAVASSAAAAPPTLTIDPPSSVSYTSAHVKGTVNPNGGPDTLYIAFEYREPGAEFWSENFVGTIEGTEAEGASPIPFELDLTGLKAGVEYEVRLRAYVEGVGPEYSPVETFTTTAVPAPSVSLDPPSAITGTTAQFSGTIDPEAPVGNPAAADVDWHFECTPACPGPSGAIAADSSPHAVSAEATGLLPNTDYEVTLVAENAGGPVSSAPANFKTQKVAPAVESLFPGRVGSAVTLRGSVNPRNSTVTYQFEWGTTAAYGNVAPATPVALGFQDNSMHDVSTAISGLAPGTTYHYRLVGTNTESSAVSHSADRSFTTAALTLPTACANDVFRVGFGAFLPDCRGYEQVSPVDKGGLEPLLDDRQVVDNFLVAPGGSTIQYIYPGAFGDAKTAVQFSRFKANRAGGTWTTHGIEIPQATYPEFGGLPNLSTSKDLSHSLFYSREALTSDAVQNYYNVYLQNNDTGELDLVFTRQQRPSVVEFASEVNIGGTPDFSHLLLRETMALTPDAPDNGKAKLYDYHDGEIHLVSFGPDDQPSTDWVPNDMNLHDAMSDDGSRLVYSLATSTAVNTDGIGVFERVNGHTVPISVSERTGEVGELEGGTVDYISNDGSAVYFHTYQPLTDAGGERAAIFGGWTYRLKNGQLTEITQRQGEARTDLDEVKVGGDGAYVYLREERGALVAWREGDSTIVGEGFGVSSEMALGTSPNGRYLAFTSSAPMTGYDNNNPAKCTSNFEQPGQCMQIFLYDGLMKELECASCRLDGGAPQGPSNFGAAAPSAFVTDDGTVAFSTPDPLVATDVNGEVDVYQFKDGVPSLISSGTSSRRSLLGGISGQDLYFGTESQLVGQDRDRLYDIYDARLNGGLANQWPPDPPAPCEGEACKGPTSSPPDTTTPGTESFQGSGKSNPRVVPSRCQALSTKARGATKKAKAKPKGKQRGKAMKQAKKLKKKASKCRAGAGR
jgi:hypothetical protein